MVLYLATGGRFARLDERDGAWQGRFALEGSGAQCLAVDPAAPATVYVGCRGGGLQRSDDAGETWSDCAVPEPDVFSLAVSPANGAVYAGTEPSRLFRSRDGAATWQELDALQDIPSRPSWSFPPRPWTSHVRWIAPHPQRAESLLVGIELGGLMRSDDAGATFSDHRPGAQGDVHALAWHPHAADRAYEAAGGGATFSVDGGHSWRAADEGRAERYVWAVLPDPDDPDRWYVSAAPGPRQAHGPGPAAAGLFRRDGDRPWQRLGEPLDAMPYALATAAGALFAGLSDGRVLRSDDGGERLGGAARARRGGAGAGRCGAVGHGWTWVNAHATTRPCGQGSAGALSMSKSRWAVSTGAFPCGSKLQPSPEGRRPCRLFAPDRAGRSVARAWVHASRSA